MNVLQFVRTAVGWLVWLVGSANCKWWCYGQKRCYGLVLQLVGSAIGGKAVGGGAVGGAVGWSAA